MQAARYTILLFFLFNLMFTYQVYERSVKPPSLTRQTEFPVMHLVNSKAYYEEGHYQRCKDELNLAIRNIYVLRECFQHRKTIDLVDTVLEDLMDVQHKMELGPVAIQEVNKAYVKVLLALVYYQVYNAREHGKEGNLAKMKIAMKSGIYILKKALLLSEGTRKMHEIAIYSQMNDLLGSSAADSVCIYTMDNILTQIGDLEIAFS